MIGENRRNFYFADIFEIIIRKINSINSDNSKYNKYYWLNINIINNNKYNKK